MADTTHADQTYTDAAHLLRRAGFGADPQTVQAAARAGLSATTNALLHPERTPDGLDDDALLGKLAGLLPLPKNGGTPTQAVRMWWVHRMVSSPNPLVEKMTLFWHGHFTSKDGNAQGEMLYRQNQTFRRNALGSFRTLALAVSRDPEMLRYLNGNTNYKAHPNENYARELMELFTTGIGHYTEDDVKAAARAFSGWNLRRGEFQFNPNQHDDDPKTFLGQIGNWNGDDIVDMLVAHPATARRLCTQLFAFFGYADPEPSVVTALTQTYYASGYDVRAVLDRLFRSRAFYSDRARFAVIKSPAQYVVGTVKMLGLDKTIALTLSEITPANDMAATVAAGQPVPAPAAPNVSADQAMRRAAGRKLGILAGLPLAMRSMGQDLFAPPSVKGWDGGAAWINTSTLMSRVAFANLVSLSRQLFGGEFGRAVDYTQGQNLTPEQWVDALAQRLGPLPLTPATRQALLDYVHSPDASDAAPPAFQPAQFTPGLPPGQFRRGRRGQTGRYNQLNGRLAGRAPGGLEGRLRGVIPLLMATPEYQVC